MPLLENIHDETRHSGKVPRRAPRNSQQQTTLIQLRNELKRAVAAEDYETAARVRDKIKSIEHEQQGRCRPSRCDRPSPSAGVARS